MGNPGGDDLVEVLSMMRAEMAGQAVSLLASEGIQGEVRRSGTVRPLEWWQVLVSARQAGRAQELLALGGFPLKHPSTAAVEEEAGTDGTVDASVKEFLDREN